MRRVRMTNVEEFEDIVVGRLEKERERLGSLRGTVTLSGFSTRASLVEVG